MRGAVSLPDHPRQQTHAIEMAIKNEPMIHNLNPVRMPNRLKPPPAKRPWSA